MLNQAAPRTREAGSGVFTDRDFEAAIKGLPNMLKSKDANLLLVDQFMAMLDYRAARGSAAAGYLSGDKTRKQAFDEIRGLKVQRGTAKPRTFEFNPATGTMVPVE